MAGNVGGIRAGKAYVEIGSRIDGLLSGFRTASQRLDSFGRSVRSLGVSLVGIGVAAKLPLAVASKQFADFESNMARVKAITGATGDEFDSLSKLAKQLGASTIFSAAQAAQAMGNFAQAGYSVQEIMQAVGPTLDLAATAQIDIAQAADIATKVMRGMGIAAEDLGGVVDVLAKAATTANTDIAMLGEAFKFVGPIAKTTGISLGEITAAIQLLSNAGIQGEMAGTTLRGMLLTLLAPGDDAADMLQSLGVRTLDARGRFVGLTNILAQLQRALAGMGSGQQLGILGRIFPDRQAAGAAELMAQGAGRLADATRRLGDSAGTAARVAGIQMDTLRGTVDILMSAVEGLGIEIGQSLAPAIREWATMISTAINSLSEWVKANRGLVVSIAKMLVVTSAAGAGLVVLGITISQVAIVASAITAAFAAIATTITLILSPIGLVTAAMIGGAIAWGKYAEAGQQAMAWLSARFAELKATALSAFAGIADALSAGDLMLAAEILWAGLRLGWVQLGNDLKAVWRDWGHAFLDVFDSASAEVSKLMVDLWAGIESGWVSLVGWLESSWRSMIATMASALIPFVDVLAKLTGVDIKTAIQDALGVVDADAIQRQTDQKLMDIEAGRRDQNAVIDASTKDSIDARRKAADEGAKADAKALADAKENLAALQQKAFFADWFQAAGDAGDAASNADTGKFGPASGLAELDSALSASAAKIDVAGSFNAAALSGLAAGDSVANDQLKEQKKATTQLEKLNRKADTGRLVFTA